jgi:ribosome-associated heat shock protein Hsp15
MSNRTAPVDSEQLRVDRWLWCARFFRTRTAAADGVRGGHVRINDQRVKASHMVRIGDVIAVTRPGSVLEVEVTGIPLRRGPATEASGHYRETEASVLRREAAAEQRKAMAALPPPPTRGRPDKRTRRLLLSRRDHDPAEE